MAAQAGHATGNEADAAALPTSAKWSVLSSRVEGLVAELSQVVGKQDAYCVEQSKAEGPVMAAIREKMLATPWGEEWEKKRTMFSYGEEMSTDPLEAMLLKQLAFMAQPRRILEIGMFAGYGSAAMLEGAPNAQVVSLDIDPYLKEWVGSCLRAFPEVAWRHEVVVGPALESLKAVTGQFDMVFVDANKAEYKAYVELILERELLSARGVLVCDNVLYNGYPYVHPHFDAQPKRRDFGNAIRDFNQWVRDHPDLEQVVLPIRDGVSLVRRRPAEGGVGGFVPGVAELQWSRAAPCSLVIDIALREKGVQPAAIEKFERHTGRPDPEGRCATGAEIDQSGGAPSFRLDDGTLVGDVLAVAEYMDETMPGAPTLVGTTPRERARVRTWFSRLNEFHSILKYGRSAGARGEACVVEQRQPEQPPPLSAEDMAERAHRRLAWLEGEKQKEVSEYIAGDFLSAADIVAYVCLWFVAEISPRKQQTSLQDLLGQLPWARTWYDRIHSRAAVVGARERFERSLDAFKARE